MFAGEPATQTVHDFVQFVFKPAQTLIPFVFRQIPAIEGQVDIAIASMADHTDRQTVFFGDAVAGCHRFGNPVDRDHDVFEGLDGAFQSSRFGKSPAGFPDFLRIGNQHGNSAIFTAKLI